MINHAIGATGIVSQECKTVVSQYGETIIELLLSEVRILFKHNPSSFFSVVTKFGYTG